MVTSIRDLVETKLKTSNPEKELLDYCNKAQSLARQSRFSFERTWYMHMSFYFGKHYAQWATSALDGTGLATESTFNRLYEPAVPSWRVRLVCNRIRSVIRGELAKITKEKPRGFVIPATTDEADLAGAHAGEALHEWLWRENQMNRVIRRAVFWELICGTAFVKDWYDKESVDQANVKGKISAEHVTPFHLLVPDLQEQELDNQPFLIHEMAKDPSWVKKHYDKDVQADSAVGGGGILEQRFLSALGIAGASNAKKYVTIREGWFKPTSKFPDGLFCIWTNEKILHSHEGWLYKHKEYPFTKLEHIPTGRFYAESSIADLIPLQKEYNRTRSQIIEAKNRMSKPQLLAVRGSVDPNRITSEPGLIIFYTPGFAAPTPLTLQNLPSYVIDEVERIKLDMDDSASQHDISRGNAPPGVSAACVDDKTQALTKHGWKYGYELTLDDEILAYDPEINRTVWQRLSGLLLFPEFEGDLHVLQSKAISARTTLDHRWLVEYTRSSHGNSVFRNGEVVGSLVETQSQNLIDDCRIPYTAPLLENNLEVWSDDFIELLGWIVTDGSLKSNSRRGGVVLYQTKSEGVDRIKKLLEGMDDITYSSKYSTWYIGGEVGKLIRLILPLDKKVPWNFIGSLSINQLYRFMEGVVGGDGTYNYGCVGVSLAGHSICVFDEHNANVFHAICAMLGLNSTINKSNNQSNRWDIYIKGDVRSKGAYVGRAKKPVEFYKGLVWCPSVDTGYWIARRENSYYVTGNTAISFLQEQDDSKLLQTVASLEEGVERIGRHFLSHVAQFWQAERMVQVTGVNGQWESYKFKSESLHGNVNFKIEAGSATPVSRAAKQAFILELMKGGYVPPEQGLKYLDMSETGRMYEDLQRDARQAQRENQKMAEGIEQLVNTYDIDLIHVQEHEGYCKTEEYENSDDQIKVGFQEHLTAHRMKMALMQGQQLAPEDPILIAIGRGQMPPPPPMLGGMNGGQPQLNGAAPEGAAPQETQAQV